MWNWLRANHHPLTAVGAMLVGLAALFIAWDQARVMRGQQHAAVWPAVQVDGYSQSRAENVRIGVRMRNGGVGPALIESVVVTRHGRAMNLASREAGGLTAAPEAELPPIDELSVAVDHPEQEWFSRFRSGVPDTDDTTWAMLSGRVIAPGEEIIAFELGWPRSALNDGDMGRISSEWRIWDIHVCYCSVFEHCWATAARSQIKPERVANCTRWADRFEPEDTSLARPEDAP